MWCQIRTLKDGDSVAFAKRYDLKTVPRVGECITLLERKQLWNMEVTGINYVIDSVGVDGVLIFCTEPIKVTNVWWLK